MNRIRVCFLLTLLLLICFLVNGKAEIPTVTLTSDSVQTMKMAKDLLTRLDEINAINKTGLSRSDCRKLRKECRRIKGDLKELDGGTYIPAGTLVILFIIPIIAFNVTE